MSDSQAALRVVDDLARAIGLVMQQDLMGLYLFGSLANDGFEPERSDLDLLAVVSADVTDAQFESLTQMHALFVESHPEWRYRVEVIYVSKPALDAFGSTPTRLAMISGSDPLEFRDAGSDWLIDWYVIREQSRSLLGPTASDLIPTITTAQYVEAVRAHMQEWGDHILANNFKDSLKAQSNAILTIARALCASKTGQQLSKQRAADWLSTTYPRWAQLVRDAQVWRTSVDQAPDPAETLSTTIEFVEWAIEESRSSVA